MVEGVTRQTVMDLAPSHGLACPGRALATRDLSDSPWHAPATVGGRREESRYVEPRSVIAFEYQEGQLSARASPAVHTSWVISVRRPKAPKEVDSV